VRKAVCGICPRGIRAKAVLVAEPTAVAVTGSGKAQLQLVFAVGKLHRFVRSNPAPVYNQIYQLNLRRLRLCSARFGRDANSAGRFGKPQRAVSLFEDVSGPFFGKPLPVRQALDDFPPFLKVRSLNYANARPVTENPYAP
jgi:hypothetical protein